MANYYYNILDVLRSNITAEADSLPTTVLRQRRLPEHQIACCYSPHPASQSINKLSTLLSGSILLGCIGLVIRMF